MPQERHYRGGLTISRKLTERLLLELQEGEFATYERLPSEVELSARFGVSRSVIRDVLSNLEREGCVERERGVGTTIIREIVNLKSRFDIKHEYNTLVRATGGNPSAEVKKLYEQPASKELAEKLHIQQGETLVVCEKCVMSNKHPVIYSIDNLPLSLFGKADYTNYNWNQSVFDLLEEECHMVVDTDIAAILPVIGPEDIRDILKQTEGHALLRVDEIGYHKLGRPVLQTLGYYTDYFEFTMLRKRI
ncbi:MAG: GntR family transcriptional regulator [Oscillospiraceae bacterium]